jgi:hypothetical protein
MVQGLGSGIDFIGGGDCCCNYSPVVPLHFVKMIISRSSSAAPFIASVLYVGMLRSLAILSIRTSVPGSLVVSWPAIIEF